MNADAPCAFVEEHFDPGPQATSENTAAQIDSAVFTAQGSPLHDLRVVRPNGDESFAVGDTMHVFVTNSVDKDVELFFSPDGARTWFPLTIASVPLVNGELSFTYAIPESVSVFSMTLFRMLTISTVSESCLIKARYYDVDDTMDVSDDFFSIRSSDTHTFKHL